MELQLKEIEKWYGNNHALKGFSFTFTPGVYGLLGPNGAGKSTLINIITDNLRADSGEILLNGESTIKLGKEFRRLLGYMPQQQGMYANFTLTRFLWYIAALKGLTKKETEKQVEDILQRVNLADVAERRLGAFSGGMKQRALIAQAMLGSPEILILDEPTAGLDPKERIRIRNLIAELALDKVVMIATHVVTDIEFIAKQVLLLKKGVLLYAGTPRELCSSIEGKVYEGLIDAKDYPVFAKRYPIGNLRQEQGGIQIRFLSEEVPAESCFSPASPTLEDVYLYHFEQQ